MSAAACILDRLEGVTPTGPHGWLARCPAHADTDPSLSIRKLDGGKVLLNCFAGCPTEDVLAAIGLQFSDLFREPEEQDSGTQSARAIAPRIYRPWQELGAYLWSSSQPVTGTIVQAYLERRGCRLPPSDGDLHYLPARGDHPAAMLARVTDIVTAEPISLHFTQLDSEGNKTGDNPKRLLSGHRKQGGCIRLWPDEAVTTGLALAEGIESALAAAHAFTPVWAAIDAGNLSQFPVLNGIEALTIVADHDDAGIRAAQACARRWVNAGKQARIVKSRTAGQDAADVAVAA